MRRSDSCRIGVARLKAPTVIRAVQQFAVLGSPISHSKSPGLHRAAYRVLGLDWEYSAVEVKSGELGSFLSRPDPRWRGLSLTMPLKREIVPFLDEHDAVSLLVGSANTVLFDDGRVRGFNTDVYGAERMLRDAIPGNLQRALILGGGATACSVVASLVNCGVREIAVATRSPSKASELVDLGHRLGITVTVGGLDTDPGAVDVVVSTLPGTAKLTHILPEQLRATVPLIDIAYSPWPTSVAKQWIGAGGGVVNNGLGMLLYQALAQVRIFVGGEPTRELPFEADVLAAMRSTVSGTT